MDARNPSMEDVVPTRKQSPREPATKCFVNMFPARCTSRSARRQERGDGWTTSFFSFVIRGSRYRKHLSIKNGCMNGLMWSSSHRRHVVPRCPSFIHTTVHETGSTRWSIMTQECTASERNAAMSVVLLLDGRSQDD